MGQEIVALSPKAYSVLLHLAERAGQLVTKEELLDALWPDTHVGEGVLKVAIAEIRKALHDVSKEPRFIETAHRRGYRFIAPISGKDAAPTGAGVRAVEREAAFAQLDAALTRALAGQRQIVFVTGETGIGKTTVVEAFLEGIPGASGVSVAHGQCLQHFGEGEPYFPVLEAIGGLASQTGRDRLAQLLRQHAPTWLAQLPSLVAEPDRKALRRDVLGAAKERMLREIAGAIETLTTEMPLILVLEDLHWSDYSTVDLIAHLAQRNDAARLLVLGTYRPAEVIIKQHPLREMTRELQVHRRCAEISLELLSEPAVARYLEMRFPGSALPSEVVHIIHERTDGNPLFLVNVADSLVSQGQIVSHGGNWTLNVAVGAIEIGIPDSLQQLIETQFERLSEEEQRVLSSASVAGVEFSTRTLAGVTGDSVAQIAAVCEALARRRQFLRPAKMIQLSDGSLLERYGFTHKMYQQVLYVAVPPHRRVALHRQFGEFQETAYAAHLEEIAAELAVHFAEGRAPARAIEYRRLSAQNALRRYANREAIEHLDKALAMVGHLPTNQQFRLEAEILEERGTARRQMDDNIGAAADFERVAERAAAAGRTDWQVQGLLKLSAALFWTDPDRSLAVAEQSVDLSRLLPDSWLHVQARGYCASRRIRLHGWRDEDFSDCVRAMESARAAGNRGFLGLHTMSYAFLQSYRSEEREACRAADEGLQIALDTNDSYLYITCQYFKAWALLHLGELGQALRLVREGVELSLKNGHATAAAVLRLIESRVHAQAFDYQGAHDLARAALDETPRGPAHLIALATLGEAHVGLRSFEQAQQCFDEVLQLSQAGPFRLDWVFFLPMHHALGELWLLQNDIGRARNAAHRLCEMAALPGQQTYLALGWALLARIALAAEDVEQAGEHLALARRAAEKWEAPLATWRVAAAEAELARCMHRNDAEFRRLKAVKLLHALAESLDEADPLRQTIMNAPGWAWLFKRRGQTSSAG